MNRKEHSFLCLTKILFHMILYKFSVGDKATQKSKLYKIVSWQDNETNNIVAVGCLDYKY